MVLLVWNDLHEQDLPDVRELASRCLSADGGMPTLDSRETIEALFGSGPGLVGRDDTGDVVAAVALFNDPAGHRSVTGLVHPSMRGQGIAEELAQWVRVTTGGAPLRATLENATAVADAVLAGAGMLKVGSELVMRHDLASIPTIRRPEGISTHAFTADTAALFHQAWLVSFADRPGFTAYEQQRWLDDLTGDPEFLPALSRVALDEEDTPVGFVTVSTGWIDQVGVAPAWRGRALGGHLMARSLTALKKQGARRVWLGVTEDNPASALYLRLGFEIVGARGRYADPRV